ncbi:unnamed protein product [Eruca vesicaria subsp. sativa]|uniref:Acidic leucine-rich nuclear phosphoprotein 32-related protein n=1 Tax=Eruca vesicaria subsp. sativa TaxID=29727 RepID=A0ABC8JYV1_ERUVS|nr:unnamed protein product [Eruca vesicaria subsp. sativa]
MDEIWEKAVETALAGETEPETTRVLTLDGAVKCVNGHLPRPEILEKYPNLEHLSIASIGVSSLDRFPRLGKLQKLVLSDNRISGGLEFLVQAGLGSLRDLDLSNNRIGLFEDLLPLAELKLVSLDLYKCPVTRMKDYRARVFGLVKSLKYLDKMDAEENEIPESEDEDNDNDNDNDNDDDDDEEEEEDGDDGEERSNGISNGHSERVDEEESEADEDGDDGEERLNVISNGHSERVVEVDEEESEADEDGDDNGEERPNVVSNGHNEGVVEVDEEESETDEEETATNGVSDHANGLRDTHMNMDEEVDDDDDDSDEGDDYDSDGLIVDDTHDIEEEEESEAEEEMLQRDIRGELDDREEVAEAGRQPDWVNDFVANGAQDVLMDIGREENDDTDGEDDDYAPDGLIVDDTHEMEEEDVGEGEGVEEVDLGVQHGNELLRNILIGEIQHEQDEDDDESLEEEDEDAIEDGEEEEEYGTGGLGQSVAEAVQVDEEESDDEVQAVYSIASSNLKRKRDEADDGDPVSPSSDNSDDDGSSGDDVPSDEDE